MNVSSAIFEAGSLLPSLSAHGPTWALLELQAFEAPSKAELEETHLVKPLKNEFRHSLQYSLIFFVF
jgi:hypothetical protein